MLKLIFILTAHSGVDSLLPPCVQSCELPLPRHVITLHFIINFQRVTPPTNYRVTVAKESLKIYDKTEPATESNRSEHQEKISGGTVRARCR